MKPILFNTEMVRAILGGRKIQTRRVVKPQLPENTIEIREVDPLGYLFFRTSDKYLDGHRNAKSPYVAGDILYVRETWCEVEKEHVIFGLKYAYRATASAESERIRKEYISLGYPYQWRPSIHMPKEAARIFLRVTNVRVERLQDITETQVRKEGFRDNFDIENDIFYPSGYNFIQIWNSSIKKQDLDKYSWNANPWVWVIEFERIEKPEGDS